jgi:hypothetical protein
MTAAELEPISTVGAEPIELRTNKPGDTANIGVEHITNEDTALTRRNLFRVIAASVSFFFAGNNDGSLGALIPYILRTYDVGTEYVALM